MAWFMSQRGRSDLGDPAVPSEEGVPRAARATVRTDRLHYHMMVRGLTGALLAQRSGVSQATVSHCLNGHRISPATLRKVCMALARVPTLEIADDLVG